MGGMFDVKIDNAVQAPHFSLGINSHRDWNKMKKYSPPFAVLRVPGQMHIYIQTKHLQTITDMVARMKDWKVTLDILDDLLGIPLNIQPGEEQLHFDPTVGGGLRWDVCSGGGKSSVGAYYWPRFVDYKNKHTTVVFHELGHGYCYSDLPDMGGQWTAEFVREYIERKRNYEVGAKNFEFPFTVLHQMVSFSKLSKGEACGVAKFPAGDDQSKTSFPYNDYFTCWTFLYRLPLWEFGWDVLRLVFTLDTESTTSYSSKTDRMADLYCQATKSNLVPLFEFYNIKISKSVADTCRKQRPSVMITNYIKIANCIMNKDIMECASLPEFPLYKGICRLSGVCNKHPDHDNKQITLNEEFDLWGGTTEPEFKRGLIDTTRNEKNCHGRAEETFKWCRNEIDQSITASFTLKNGDSSSQTFPLSDDPFDEIWSDSQCKNIGRGIKDLEVCKAACRGKTGCTAVNFCTKGNDCVLRACKDPIPAPTWKYRDDCKGHTVGPDDPGDKIWSDSQCRNIGRGIKDLEECKAACRMKIDCTAVNFCTKGNDCVFRACKEPIPAPAWKYRDDCKGHIAGSVPVGAREEYLALKIDGSDEYFKQVKKLLPQLLWADLLDEGEVGVALARQSVYPALDFRREEGVFDLRPKNQVVTINGTVTKKIGKRSYTAAKFRQTGLYAAPGDIVTITIPPQPIGKISAHIGQDDKAAIKFETLNKAVNKIASPYGGLILVYLSDIDATTKEGIFEVKIDNAVQAPFFTLGINTNEEWNQMKMYSPPFTVMRIPGQIVIYMQTKHLQTITDMVARLKDWKVTIDILDDLVGVPLNIQPGEERFHYDPTRGGGVRWDVCAGGGKSEADAAYWPKFVDYKNKHPTVVFHELGHGYCYSDLPDMGAQWTAELVREYIERKRNYEVGAKNFEFPFTYCIKWCHFQ